MVQMKSIYSFKLVESPSNRGGGGLQAHTKGGGGGSGRGVGGGVLEAQGGPLYKSYKVLGCGYSTGVQPPPPPVNRMPDKQV